MNTVFINGKFCASEDATISIFDRGLLFGDAVYEVLPVYRGQPYFVDRHLARLKANLEKIKIKMPSLNWIELIDRLISENNGDDLQVYIQITRGNQGLRKHDIPKDLEPSVIAFTLHNPYPTQEEKERGLSAKLIKDLRWLRCDIKTTSLLANILLHDEAISSGYQTSILERDGIITEGSVSNIFIVTQQEVIKSPPLDHLCLPGITRQIAIELIKNQNWSFKEESISTEELFNAQEVWLTSTSKEIYPITRVNETAIHHGQVGKYWHIINQAYQQLIS